MRKTCALLALLLLSACGQLFGVNDQWDAMKSNCHNGNCYNHD